MNIIYEAYQKIKSSYLLKKDIDAQLEQMPETHIIKRGTKINLINLTKKWARFKIDGDKSNETWYIDTKVFNTSTKSFDK